MEIKIKALPKDLEAERQVLSILLNEPSLLEEETIYPEMFWSNENRIIFKKLLEKYEPGQGFDIPVIYEELEKKIDIEYFEKLTDEFLTAVSFKKYLNRLINVWKKRELLKEFYECWQKTKDSDIDEVLLELNKKTGDLVSRGREPEIKTIKDRAVEYMEELQNIIARKKKPGIKTGLYDLDNMMSLEGGNLIIVAGRPSMGKTLFSLVMIKNNCENGKKVGFFSLEMPAKLVVNRFVKMLGGAGKNEIIREKREEDINKTVELLDIIGNWDLRIDDTPATKLSDLMVKIRRMVKFYGVEIVYIDYLSYILPDRREQSKNLEIENITRSLKALAKELDIPIVLLSQLNRSVENRTDKRPALSDLRESGAIEQDADVVLMLYRPYYYTQREEQEHLLSCFVRKNREGRVGEVKFYINLEKQQITSLYEGGFSDD